jgi:hypothetical protein
MLAWEGFVGTVFDSRDGSFLFLCCGQNCRRNEKSYRCKPHRRDLIPHHAEMTIKGSILNVLSSVATKKTWEASVRCYANV